VIAVAVSGALVPLPAFWVERVYSLGVYPRLQAALTTASNLVPFALLDALVVIAAVWWLVMLVGEIRSPGRPSGRFGVILLRTGAGAATLFLVFLACWGLNYRRVPLVQKLQFDAQRVSRAGAVALAEESVQRLNALHRAAHDSGRSTVQAVDPALAGAFTLVQRDVGLPPARPGYPKRSILDL
jgi:hypothetical protein